MSRCTTDSFVTEIPLKAGPAEERAVLVRLDAARQVYNAVLAESLKRLGLLRQSKAYQAAQKLSAGPPNLPDTSARAKAFRAANAAAGFREYDLHTYAKQFGHSWLGEHLDANTIQTVASRAFRAVKEYALGQRGKPRFKGQCQFDSVEGKTNKQGIRWRHDHLEWNGLLLPAIIDADPVIAHGLCSRIKYVRLVRRKLNGRNRFYAQLICEGRPYRKPKNSVGSGVIGIDPGPRTFGIAGADWGVQVDLATPLKASHQKMRCLQRHIDRQRRANNPDNYLPDGCICPGPKKWYVSNRQRQALVKLAEIQRKDAAHRKSLHGQLANAVLLLGNDIRIEKNSYRSFQRNFGKSVGLAAPAGFVSLLVRKAESASAQAAMLPRSLRLSQLCHGCGTIEKKPLSQRLHQCECGVGPVQRDVYSAWLARFAVAADGSGQGAEPEWRLDGAQMKVLWASAESRLLAASSLPSLQAFAAWARQQSASSSPPVASLLQNGTEQIAGEVSARIGEARNDVGHVKTSVVVLEHVRESEKAGRVGTRTPRL